MRRLVLAALQLLALAIIFAALLWPARAEGDFPDATPQQKQWFRSVQNQRGDVCCDETEAVKVDGYRFLDGEWRVAARGVTVSVPPERSVTARNPYGEAILWIFPRGAPLTNESARCFLRGLEG